MQAKPFSDQPSGIVTYSNSKALGRRRASWGLKKLAFSDLSVWRRIGYVIEAVQGAVG
jgi:hypothetical protein